MGRVENVQVFEDTRKQCKQNTDLSNLRMIKRSELLVMNRYGLYTENAELNNTAVNLATLMDKTARKKHI